ncbi:MAG: alpha/beta hydrolase [Candidatus Saccharibacteria bacterium]|nr:alpha/beta hydrolase [Candidatus Saccharibacteria bacterium]
MKKKTDNSQASAYISPLNMDGLRGRMLHMPAPKGKRRQILLVYGHHCSLERMFGFAEYMNKYGAVTMPDLPGFGGMDTFYSIGEKPTLDNLADYLAAFVKLRYKRRRVTIAGMSFGSLVVTRMLQRHPDIIKKVDTLVSIVGFSHHEDFKFKRSNYWLLRIGASLFSRKWPARFVRRTLLTKPMIRLAYKMSEKNHSKFRNADSAEIRRRVNFEITLWQCNDVRTYMYTGKQMLTVDLCNSRVPLKVYHVAVEDDRYFDNNIVKQHLGVIFDKVTVIPTTMPAHAPSVIAEAKEAAAFIPQKMRRILAKQ